MVRPASAAMFGSTETIVPPAQAMSMPIRPSGRAAFLTRRSSAISALLPAERNQQARRRARIARDQRHGDNREDERKHQEDLVREVERVGRLQTQLESFQRGEKEGAG